MGKRRLVFDLTDEEYEEFKRDAEEAGDSKIDFFRFIWKNGPFSQVTIENDNKATRTIADLTSIGTHIFLQMSKINATGDSLTPMRTSKEDWDTCIKKIEEIVEQLKKTPFGVSDEDFPSLEYPEWIGAVNANLDLKKIGGNRKKAPRIINLGKGRNNDE